MPSIVVEVDHSTTEHTTKNLKTGTVRVDLILDKPQAQPITTPPSSPQAIPGMVSAVSPIGEVLERTEDHIVQKLSSGTIRTDITKVEPPTPINYWSF
ncbi:hypothetical protein COMA1_10530 [Candidatus Nitrospira nitrosa]|uniref:Uncharacterized protein n=1 Tax=Candidatus Nitrospira nitrosa TaxID=1742972 RepID=A0A0S4L6C7_9BACT|nr:hypothetical protein [Candidatus Nitrospira nitrosa]CUS32250.1 hypothetical protein COMA1_10530 [Candidatus Nitrospira nitrosa]